MDGQVKKMVLVPADLVAKSRPVDRQLSEIDTDMDNILGSQGIPADVKMKLFADALARYGVKQREAERPLQMPIRQETQQKASATDLLRNIPERKKPAAEELLAFLQDSNAIQWNDKKELVLDGTPIHGSNIRDLFHHASRDRSMVTAPTGWHEFIDALYQNNVPRMALGNKHITGEAVAAAATQTPPIQSPATPPAQAGRPGRVFKRTPQKGKGVFKFVSQY